MAYTELYCDPVSGANTNAGAPIGGIYPVVSTNGSFTRSTGAGSTDVFAAASGTPFSGCAVGDFVANYVDGAIVAAYVARITAINGGGSSIDISITAFSGVRPATTASGRTAVVGGAWKGPSAGIAFPFNFVSNVLRNAANDVPRVNFRNNATYSTTSLTNHTLIGPIFFSGYTSTPGDRGKALMRGPATGASFVMLSFGQDDIFLSDFDIGQNGQTGIANGLAFGGVRATVHRVAVHHIAGSGFACTNNLQVFFECEAYNCNTSASATKGGFALSGSSMFFTFIRCISHDNFIGFFQDGSSFGTLIGCIADTNDKAGYQVGNFGTGAGISRTLISGCDFYNNNPANAVPGGGINCSVDTTTHTVIVENTNLIKNGGYAIQNAGTGFTLGYISNCGYGAGAQANGLGTINNLKGVTETGAVTYPSSVTPWTDPASGDFRINLAEAKNTGRGSYQQTQAGYGGAIAYPDIGAAQHQESAGGGAIVVVDVQSPVSIHPWKAVGY